jgi:hypothetical protein
VSFVYNDDIGVQGEQVGFIAEEVFKIDPRLVTLDASSTPNNVKYANFTAILARAMQEIASITGAFKDALITWLGSATNGLTRVHTQELCVDDVCVTRDQFAEVFGSSQSAAAAGAGPATETAPSGSSTPVASEDADTATSTTPSDNEPAADAPEGPSVAPAASAQEAVLLDGSAEVETGTSGSAGPSPAGDAVSPPSTEPANDNQPAEDLPATGTE